MKTKFMILLAALGLTAANSWADAITLDFKGNSVTGGTLLLTESGTDATDDFTGDRFDELAIASFQITGLPTYGSLTITASALVDDLNVTGSGLQDGSSGYNAAGEGTSFVFNRDVIITALDWGSFTSDTVILRNGATNLGTFTTGSPISGGIDFSDTDPAVMSITVAQGDAFVIENDSGTFYLESMNITAIPEPSSIMLMGLVGIVAVSVLRKRK